MTDEERLSRGFAVRRRVLGDAHVDRAEANKTNLTADFQNFLTRYAWGEVWNRPGLDQKTRRLLTIAMLIPLNREPELAMHFRAALENDVAEAELSELILHSSLYCGLPAANAAFHLLQQQITDKGSQKLEGN